MGGTGAGSSRRLPPWLPLLLILTLGATLRIYRLGFENYWLDEVFSLEQAASSPVENLKDYWNLPRPGNSQPLSLVLAHYTLRWSDSEFLTRLPYALLSILEIGALFLLAREIASRRVALFAALMLAVLPLHVWYAHELRWYSQWSLLTTLGFLMLVRAWKSDRLRTHVGYGVVVLLSLYTFVVAIAVVACQIGSALLLPNLGAKRSFYRKLLLVLVAVGLLALPTLLIAIRVSSPSGASSPRVASSPSIGVSSPSIGVSSTSAGSAVGTPRPTNPAVLPYTLFAYFAGYSMGPTVAELHSLPAPNRIVNQFPEVVLYFVVFAPLVALGLWRLRTRTVASAILIPWVVGVPLLLIVTAMLGGQTYNVRYTLVAASGSALLLAVGLDSIAHRGARWLATTVVLVCFGASLGNYYWNARYDKENVRGAVAQIRASGYDDEPVAVIGQAMAPLSYYGQELEVMQVRSCAPTDNAPERTDVTDLQAEPALWLLVSRDWGKQSLICLQELQETHRVVMHRSLTGVELWLLSR
jgi:uncharacterized membrane protein